MSTTPRIFVLLILLFGWLGCKLPQPGQTIGSKTGYRFAFYNVENLFDTLDHPQKIDEAFTPQSEKAWNTERYQTKLSNIAFVIQSLGFPVVLGVSEVENAAVLKDLTQHPTLAGHGYDFVHYESPDMRGIDVAFLYKKGLLEVKKSDFIRIDFPDTIQKDYTSRDILQINAALAGQEAYFFVNHWPSRYGGTKASEPKRLHVAQYLRRRVEQIQASEPKTPIFIMGDFNDETTNRSLTQVLIAHGSPPKPNALQLYNCSAPLDTIGKGSHNYRGEWGMLDQFIVSSNTLSRKAPIHTVQFGIYDAKEIQFYDKRNQMYRPNRTYGGPNYYGGYSDHLPVYLDVVVRE